MGVWRAIETQQVRYEKQDYRAKQDKYYMGTCVNCGFFEHIKLKKICYECWHDKDRGIKCFHDRHRRFWQRTHECLTKPIEWEGDPYGDVKITPIPIERRKEPRDEVVNL